MPDVAVVEPKFKIIGHSTHAENGAGIIEDKQDQLLSPPAPAEPASSQETPAVAPSQSKEPEVTPAASADPGEPPKVNEAKIGASKKVVEPPKTEEPAKIEPAPTAPKGWEDSLKEQGFDERAVNLLKVLKQGNDLKPYVEALSTDFTKMSSEQVMRYHLQREYPTATPEQLDLLYEDEVRDRYKLDADKYLPDTMEAKAGKVKLEMDAQKYRSRYTEELGKFQLPTFDIQAETLKQQEAQKQEQQARINDFYNNDYVKTVATDKKITFKDLGDKIPNYTVNLEDPEEVMAILTNPAIGQKYITDDKGNLDREAQMQIAAFASNRRGFIQTWINYGKTLGKEELVEEKSNPPKKQGQEAAPNKETLKEAFANRGRQGRGG